MTREEAGGRAKAGTFAQVPMQGGGRRGAVGEKKQVTRGCWARRGGRAAPGRSGVTQRGWETRPHWPGGSCWQLQVFGLLDFKG